MPDFHIGDVIQQQGDDDNTEFVVMARNEPKSTYTLLFESDEELFDEINDILFRIPKKWRYKLLCNRNKQRDH